jgi:26S proteasome regulatory subunit N3
LNRRTCDQVASRIYFYFVRFYELLGRVQEIYPFLLATHRTSVLRQDTETQATVINSLLKYYLDLNLIDQADKLVSKTTYPENAQNNQIARYMYYLGL